MIIVHKRFFPSFSLGKPDQTPTGIYTVLSINEAVGDCAAYRGIGPDQSNMSDRTQNALIEAIRTGGEIIEQDEAIDLFDEIEGMNLHYRN